ncbi:unnamed protein product [Auanema sp. JU1783]|nr:unnamed protein product [Auanema sp. JU1783]
MSENQYAPLTPAVVRILTDKLYEKRKSAALDIEKQVRDLYASNQLSQLDKLLTVLRELAMGSSSHTRQGGLIGLAAAAIALGKNAGPFTTNLIEPVLACFNDPDLRVRYYACESLYNIVKICKTGVLEHFEQLFDVLWKLSADSDQNVRSGAELLDRLLMDIVVAQDNFDIAKLMVLLRERIYGQISSHRRFIVSWLNTLLTTPSFNLLPYLSEVSDGLLKMLGDAQPAVRDVTETVLGQFLLGIKNNPLALSDADRAQIVNVLIVHSHEDETALCRRLALSWMDEFIRIYQEKLLPFLAPYLKAILPSLENDGLKAKSINEYLLNLVNEKSEIDHEGMDNVIDVLLLNIQHNRDDTRIAVLNWIRHLHVNLPVQLFVHMDRIFPRLLATLSDTCDKLSSVSPFLIKFSISLLEMFRADTDLLNDRGVLIVRQLCLLLDPAHIFLALSVLLLEKEENVTFIQKVVSMLHGVLLTATELFVLRDQLKDLKDPETVPLFECIFRCWCHRPIALLGLCLLSQHYSQAEKIALLLSKVDITLDVLIEVDKLVSMLESPVLAYVRMDLLSNTHQRHLSTVLSALLMILPQSDAFHTLHKRLQAVPALTTVGSKAEVVKAKVNFDSLFTYLDQALQRRQQEIRRHHRQIMQSTLKQLTISN